MSQSKCIVGMAGQALSGKDYLAQGLASQLEEQGLSVDTISFSDPVREHAAQCMAEEFNVAIALSRYIINDVSTKDSCVRLLQGENTRDYICRKADEAKVNDKFVFIKAWQDMVSNSSADVIINPSLRSQDEVDFIQSERTIYVTVNNPLASEPTGIKHKTERELALRDPFVFSNPYVQGDEAPMFRQEAFECRTGELVSEVISVVEAVCRYESISVCPQVSAGHCEMTA